MTTGMTNSKKLVTNRQLERDTQQGKIKYRLREIEEMEQKKVVKDYIQCSCLDSAFERQAIDSGLVTEPAFPENKIYMKQKNANKQI